MSHQLPQLPYPFNALEQQSLKRRSTFTTTSTTPGGPRALRGALADAIIREHA